MIMTVRYTHHTFLLCFKHLFFSDVGITIENETYVFDETDSVQVCVRVTDGTLERNVTVTITTMDGSAISVGV